MRSSLDDVEDDAAGVADPHGPPLWVGTRLGFGAALVARDAAIGDEHSTETGTCGSISRDRHGKPKSGAVGDDGAADRERVTNLSPRAAPAVGAVPAVEG